MSVLERHCGVCVFSHSLQFQIASAVDNRPARLTASCGNPNEQRGKKFRHFIIGKLVLICDLIFVICFLVTDFIL